MDTPLNNHGQNKSGELSLKEDWEASLNHFEDNYQKYKQDSSNGLIFSKDQGQFGKRSKSKTEKLDSFEFMSRSLGFHSSTQIK